MRVSEIMTAGVQTVRPGTPAANARERMRTKQIHHLLVKEGAEVVGVLSARDLGALTAAAPPNECWVADFMTPRVVTVDTDTSVHRAANLMRGHSIGSLIVVDQGRAVGCFDRLLLGSVSEGVARRAACSVEIIRGRSRRT